MTRLRDLYDRSMDPNDPLWNWSVLIVGVCGAATVLAFVVLFTAAGLVK